MTQVYINPFEDVPTSSGSAPVERGVTVVNGSTPITVVDSSTAITVTPGTHQVSQSFPGLDLPQDATPEQMDRFLIVTTQYTGAEPVNVEKYLSLKNPRTGLVDVFPVETHGMLCYGKVMVDKQTGEKTNAVGVVFKVFNESAGDFEFISFTSIAAWNFAHRLLIPVRGVGDWDRPLWLKISRKSLQVGHTYLFQVIDAPKGAE